MIPASSVPGLRGLKRESIPMMRISVLLLCLSFACTSMQAQSPDLKISNRPQRR